jgi:signal-transduction protein with cAMP-binding, CBS, and nucleotidyltransferase domain
MISFSNSERFKHLEAADQERLETLVKLDQFAPGEVVASAEKPSEWLSILCNGKVEVRVPGPHGEIVLATLKAGDIYGELETFAKLPEGMRLVATAETLVRACPKNPLVQELRAHRKLAVGLLFAYCRSISEKIRQANDVLVRERAQSPNTSLPPPARGTRPPHLTCRSTKRSGSRCSESPRIRRPARPS